MAQEDQQAGAAHAAAILTLTATGALLAAGLTRIQQRWTERG